MKTIILLTILQFKLYIGNLQVSKYLIFLEFVSCAWSFQDNAHISENIFFRFAEISGRFTMDVLYVCIQVYMYELVYVFTYAWCLGIGICVYLHLFSFQNNVYCEKSIRHIGTIIVHIFMATFSYMVVVT